MTSARYPWGDESGTYPPRCFAGPDLAHARREFETARGLGLRLLSPDDAGFPVLLLHLLLHIPDPPLVIYMGGTLAREPALAMVRARRATRRGREVARSLSAGAAEAGLCIMSGLGNGIPIIEARPQSGSLWTARVPVAHGLRVQLVA